MSPIIAATVEHNKETITNSKPRLPHQFQPGHVANPNGRPKGANNKLSIKSLLAQLSDTVGKSYEQQLAENYRDAIVSGDRKTIHAYDNLFLSKLLADKVDLTIDNNVEQLDAKREAFMSALSAYGQTVLSEHDAITVQAITVNPTVTNDNDDVNTIK